jgi:hypothetical protein
VPAGAAPPVCDAVGRGGSFAALEQDVQDFFVPEEIAVDLQTQGEREAEEERVDCRCRGRGLSRLRTGSG